MPSSTVKQRLEHTLVFVIRKLDNESLNIPRPVKPHRYRPYLRSPLHRVLRSMQLHSADPELIDMLLDAYTASLSQRYLCQRPHPGSTWQKREEAFEEKFGHDESLWKKDARITFTSFKVIRDMIKDDAVFKNDSYNPQDSVSYQLLLALCRFGGYGNKSSYVDVAVKLGVSVGSVDNYTRRVIAAICRRTKQHVNWPDQTERDAIKHSIGRQSIFYHCVGFIDGTLIPFAYKPSVEGASDFFNRKHRYSMNVMAVCDNWKCFTYLRIGTVGSANDQAVLSSSQLFLHPERYFTPEEYLLADSGYTPDKWIIAAYKNPVGGRMTEEQNKFNYEISRVRIAVEHAIGILKERFQSLKEMRIRIRGQESMRYANLWVRACFILHNILVGELCDEAFLEGEDRLALENQWHRQAQEQQKNPPGNETTSLAQVTSGRQPAGHPIFRSALLEDAVTRNWQRAYEV